MKLLEFLSPSRFILLVLILLLLLLPVFYVYFEPERTNYLPGEKQTYLVKSRLYPGTLREFAFHTEGGFDLFLGILSRNYVNNLAGPILIFVYYLLASALNWAYQRIRTQTETSRKE